MSRKSKLKPIKHVIIIYCEGFSEVEYFEMLRRKYHRGGVTVQAVGIDITAVKSMKGPKLIQTIIKKINMIRHKQVDGVYAVFDRDDLTDVEVREAFKLAERSNIKVIFSSTNFEIWILCHFKFFSRAYTKNELNRILSGKQYFDTDYARFKGAPYDSLLYDKVSTALTNARRLAKQKHDPVTDQPFINIQDYLVEIYGRED